MIGEISRDEVRSAIEDKLCAHFSVTSASATDDQVFQATAIVINEIMSRLLAAESPTKHEKEGECECYRKDACYRYVPACKADSECLFVCLFTPQPNHPKPAW